jgi:hypothetical protein
MIIFDEVFTHRAAICQLRMNKLFRHFSAALSTVRTVTYQWPHELQVLSVCLSQPIILPPITGDMNYP